MPATRRASIQAVLALVAGTLIAVSAAAPPARASNGASPVAYGAKQAGRAGAETGVADDAIAGAVNPAALGEIPGFRADAGVAWLISRYHYVNARNDQLSQSFDTFVPALGISWDPTGAAAPDSPEAWRGGDFRVGLSFFVPVGGGGDDEFKTAVFPQGQREYLSFSTLALAPSFAFRATDWLTIGVSPHLYYTSIETEGLVGSSTSADGRVFRYRNPDGTPLAQPDPVIVSGQQVRYSEFFAQSSTQDTNQSSRLIVENATGIGFGGTIGLFARPLDELSVGLAYRFEGHVPKVRGKARLDATQAFAAAGEDGDFGAFGPAILGAYLPDGGNNGFRSEYDFESADFRIPSVLSVGLAYRPLPATLFAFDFKWIGWKSAFDRQEITLSKGTNGDINAVNGDSTIRSDKIQEWHDQFVFAIGSAQRITDWLVVRGGVNYGRNPIPARTSGITTGHTEVHSAFGLGFIIDRFDIDLAYVYALPATLTIEHSTVNPDLNGTSIRAEQHALWLQAGITF